jgi:ATP-dependent helicase HepA
MSDTVFAVGQRWVSNSEAELGLGIIKENSGRRVVVTFPAIAEERTYAVDNAPLSRLQYSVGETVKTSEGEQFTLTARHELNGCLIYQGENDAGKEFSIHEIDLSAQVQFSQPQDRLFAGQIDKNHQFELRVEALFHSHRLQQSKTFGLIGPRVELLPHQLYIAHQVASRYRPRVLLADEVGLGKTIEAGLITHQLLVSGKAERVLIVVPDSLVHQWLVEMLRRFNLQFTLLDEERCEAIHEAGESNAFESAQLVLCSLSLLTDNDDLFQLATKANWDLMIVDEAHHLHWHENEVSKAYQCVEQLAGLIPGLLLLTATPEQLGIDSHFARLRLLDPERYPDLSSFKAQEEAYKPVSDLVADILGSSSIDDLVAIQPRLIAYFDKAYIAESLSTEDFELVQNKLVQDLLDRHGTGRVLFRNTRDVVTGFPERQLLSYPLTTPEQYTDSYVEASLSDKLQAEHILGDGWLNLDSRVTWLVNKLKENKTTKILVICAQAETAEQLEQYLRIKQGIRSSVFNENMSLINRDRSAAYFADKEEGSQVLVCSEIGSEGRNFQFAHDLVLFDLPLNPDLLEQRTGRLDRIGQRHTVNIHVPHYDKGAQATLVKVYHHGLNCFEKVFPAAGSLFNEYFDQLTPHLSAIEPQADFDTLIAKLKQRKEQISIELQQGRDRLLELNSCNKDDAEELMAELAEVSQSHELASFMTKVFDEYGVEQQTHSADSVILTPGDHMLEHSFPALPEDGITATYNRHRALSREDMAFLSWEYPMVLGGLDMILNSDFGNTAFCTLDHEQIADGTLLLEAIFKVVCPAPKYLQISRYLTQSYVRIVTDEKGREYSQLLDEAQFNSAVGRIPTITKQELVKRSKPNITNLVTQAKALASQRTADIIEQSLTQANALLDNEITRLIGLAKVNDAIKPEEIENLKKQRDDLLAFIEQSEFSLDAIRVSIVTPSN